MESPRSERVGCVVVQCEGIWRRTLTLPIGRPRKIAVAPNKGVRGLPTQMSWGQKPPSLMPHECGQLAMSFQPIDSAPV
jgi:hypothetical protein